MNKNMLDFPTVTKANSTDWVSISQGGANRKISLDNFMSEINGGNPFDMTVRTETSTTRLLTLADRNAYIRCTNAGAVTLSIGASSTYGWKLNDSIIVRQAGDGEVGVVGEAGVTINAAPAGLTTSVKGQVFQVICVDDLGDEWDVVMGGNGAGNAPPVPISLPFSSVLTPDVSSSNYQLVSLTGNALVDTPLNSSNGLTLTLALTADGSSRTLSFSAPYNLGSTSLTVAANTKSIYTFIRRDATNWDLTSYTSGL